VSFEEFYLRHIDDMHAEKFFCRLDFNPKPSIPDGHNLVFKRHHDLDSAFSASFRPALF